MFKTSKIIASTCVIALSACATTDTVDGDKGIVSEPARSLNLTRTEIPAFLADANDPYVSAAGRTCSDLADEVSKLTAFAGPDWDSPDHYSKNGGKSTDAAGFIPYGGFIRFFSGASAHEKKVFHAADYSNVRRSYLKAVASSQGCAL